jgi:chromosome segregation ATPase
VTWWQTVLVAVAAGGTSGLAAYAVAWLNRKGAKEVAESGAKVDNRRVDIEGLEKLVKMLQGQLASQDQRITLLDKHRRDDQERIDELERSLDREERGRAAAIRYIRKLLDWITEHMPAHTPPEIPAILREDLTT